MLEEKLKINYLVKTEKRNEREVFYIFVFYEKKQRE